MEDKPQAEITVKKEKVEFPVEIKKRKRSQFEPKRITTKRRLMKDKFDPLILKYLLSKKENLEFELELISDCLKRKQ